MTSATRPVLRGHARALAWLRDHFPRKWLFLTSAITVVGLLALTPLVFLIAQALFAGGFSLETIGIGGAARSLPRLIWTSCVFAAGTGLVASVVGSSLAYIYERTDLPFRGVIMVVALIPLVVPNILYVIAWILLASPRVGLINGVLEGVLAIRPLDIFSMPGMIWVEGTNLSSLVFLIVSASMRAVDPSLEEAAALSGARGTTILRRVTLPLAAPALAGASLLVAMRALGTFETPALLGLPGGVFVFTSTIWLELSRFPANISNASGLSLWLVAISGVLVLVYFKRFGGERARRYQTISGKDFRTRRRALSRRAKISITVVLLLWVFIALILPLIALLYTALIPVLRLPSMEVLRAVSFDNFINVITTDTVERAFFNSFLLAAATGTIVMGLTALVAWFMIRTRVRGRWLIDVVSFMPMAMPGLVVGLAILIVYLRVPLPIYGTLGILLIAYVTSFLPHGMRYATPAVIQIGSELEEAAEMSGALWTRMYRKITLPLIWPGLLAGWIFIASISVRELSASLLVYSQGNEVLGIALWDLWHDGETAEAAALGILMIIALLLLMSVVRLVGGSVATLSGGGRG